MFQRILVPLDGSERAERAIPVAARLARASGGSVILLQVVSPPLDYGGGVVQVPLLTEQVIETLQAEANSYLDTLAKSDGLAGIEIKTDVVFGLPAQDILAVVKLRRVDLIVMCSHGRTGFVRWALGSVTHRVIHHSSIPVLVLREGGPDPTLSHADPSHALCALVALDGSLLAEMALVPAVNLVTALAAPGQGALHLTQVVKVFPTTAEEGFVSELNEEALARAKEYLATVEERLQETYKDRELAVAWSVALDSDVADAIIGTAEHGEHVEGVEGFSGCDLIAMSTHGRGGLERWVMGSVTERVLSATKLPILVVRPRHAETNME